jgi:hypothetical protein
MTARPVMTTKTLLPGRAPSAVHLKEKNTTIVMLQCPHPTCCNGPQTVYHQEGSGAELGCARKNTLLRDGYPTMVVTTPCWVVCQSGGL